MKLASFYHRVERLRAASSVVDTDRLLSRGLQHGP
jgi:hypothetical protein